MQSADLFQCGVSITPTHPGPDTRTPMTKSREKTNRRCVVPCPVCLYPRGEGGVSRCVVLRGVAMRCVTIRGKESSCACVCVCVCVCVYSRHGGCSQLIYPQCHTHTAVDPNHYLSLHQVKASKYASIRVRPVLFHRGRFFWTTRKTRNNMNTDGRRRQQQRRTQTKNSSCRIVADKTRRLCLQIFTSPTPTKDHSPYHTIGSCISIFLYIRIPQKTDGDFHTIPYHTIPNTSRGICIAMKEILFLWIHPHRSNNNIEYGPKRRTRKRHQQQQPQCHNMSLWSDRIHTYQQTNDESG